MEVASLCHSTLFRRQSLDPVLPVGPRSERPRGGSFSDGHIVDRRRGWMDRELWSHPSPRPPPHALPSDPLPPRPRGTSSAGDIQAIAGAEKGPAAPPATGPPGPSECIGAALPPLPDHFHGADRQMAFPLIVRTKKRPKSHTPQRFQCQTLSIIPDGGHEVWLLGLIV